LPERQDRLEGLRRHDGIDPLVAVARDGRIALVLGARLPVHAIEEGVDERVALVDPELREKSLKPRAGLADENAPYDRLVLSGILPDDEDTRGAVEPAAVEDRAPLGAKIFLRVDLDAWEIGCEALEGFAYVPGVEFLHRAAPFFRLRASVGAIWQSVNG